MPPKQEQATPPIIRIDVFEVAQEDPRSPSPTIPARTEIEASEVSTNEGLLSSFVLVGIHFSRLCHFSEHVISSAPEQVGASPVDESIKQNPPAEDTSAPKREEGYLHVMHSNSSETGANAVENASTNAVTHLTTQPMAEEGSSGSTQDSVPPLPAVPEPTEPVEASSNPAQDEERPLTQADSAAGADQAEELTSETQPALDA
jgi:hypothetical protein